MFCGDMELGTAICGDISNGGGGGGGACSIISVIISWPRPCPKYCNLIKWAMEVFIEFLSTNRIGQVEGFVQNNSKMDEKKKWDYLCKYTLSK